MSSGRPAVYVDQAESLGSVAIIRSLGSAGYEIHAASEFPHALGARSRFAEFRPVHPPVHSEAFIGWFRAYIERNAIAAVIPSERLVLSLGPHLGEFVSLIPLGHSADALLRGFSKYELFESALDHGLTDNLVPFRIVDFDHQASRATGEMRFPAFIKIDAIHSRTSGQKGGVRRVENQNELEDKLQELSTRFRRAVVQAYAPGVGVGACFVVWNGVCRASFLHRRLHEVPYTGGISSWRNEFFHEGIQDDALARIRALGWRGPAMVEYRWDPESGRFALMEMNSRFWGSLHLPYYCGVDFPAMLMASFLGEAGISLPKRRAPAFPRRQDLSCRHLPAEVQHYWSRIKSQEISMGSKILALTEFARLTLDPRVRSDLGSQPGDRHLLFIALMQFASAAFRALGARRRRNEAQRSFKRQEAA